jgi:hypothetical protein
MEFKTGNSYKLRNGQTVKCLATNAAGDQPLVVLFKSGVVGKRYPNGSMKASGSSSFDITAEVFTTTKWANVYGDKFSTHATKESAEEACDAGRGGRTVKLRIVEVAEAK